MAPVAGPGMAVAPVMAADIGELVTTATRKLMHDDGAGCLADLDRVAAIDAKLDLRLAATRGQCEMLSGKCPFDAKAPEEIAMGHALKPAPSLAPTLAEIGAFAGLPDQPSRREALWQVSQLAQSGGPLLQRLSDDASPLAEMSLAERVLADLEGTGVTVGPHPLRLCRPQLAELGAVTAERVGTLPHGTEVRVAGLVIVRQRPATARGAFFLTMEDESGLLSATVSPQDFGAMRPVLISATGLLLHGTVDVRDGARSLRVSRCYDLGQVLSAYGATLRPTTTYGRSYG